MREIRLTLRHLAKSPGYTIAALVTLALAIGATTAIFSAVYAVLLHPTPIREPSQLIMGWGMSPARSEGLIELTYRDVEALGTASRTLSSAAAVGASTWTTVLDGEGDSVQLAYAGVSGTFFDTFGAAPLLGRTIRPADDMPNGPNVVVLSYGAWVRRFGSDPAIVGRTLRLDEQSQEVIGVMPPGFDYPRGAELWAPLAPGLSAAGEAWKTDVLANVGVLYLVGRLEDGVTATEASADLTTVAQGLDRQRPSPLIGDAVVVTPFLDHVIGPARKAIWALFGAVGVLLLIACANVSGLMLTRASLRHREHALRVALGATSRDLGRGWIIEATTLAVVGGALGLLLAQWLTAAILSLAPDGIPRLVEASINLPVAFFALAATLATALFCGIGPIREAGLLNVVEGLGEGGRSTESARSLGARSTLLVLQIAMAVVLLVAAGLVVRSVTALRQIDLGFQQDRVLTLQLDPRLDRQRVNPWVRELIAGIATRPGVESVGAVYLRPLALGPIGQGTWVLLEGQPDTPDARSGNPGLNYQVATPGYFTAMRIPLRRGRVFAEADDNRTERVAIVGESTASRLWPGEDPVGKRLLIPTFNQGQGGPSNAWRTVVGVVSDVRYRGIGEVSLDIYDPAAQSSLPATDLVIRTAGDPLALASIVQEDARRLEPRVLVTGITTLDAIVSRELAPWRFSAWLLSLFAMLAFALAMVGLFSLVSLDVAHRRHEFAIRLALGATKGDIATRVFRSAIVRGISGLALGLVAAGLSVRAIRSLLFGVPLFDWPTYAVVVLLVSVVVAIASYWPVRVAAVTDPISLLRRE
jgi:putative ABC transport system permease protein